MKLSKAISLESEMWSSLDRLHKDAYPTWSFSRLVAHVLSKGFNHMADEAKERMEQAEEALDLRGL